ncbi:unnamed protein product [Orchesella dallaii]|uniref:Uncharacterized protein n=1 Tax=Orchesella dallaii TaxID=48710 RepID=A0ABP1R1J0_9HEXA
MDSQTHSLAESTSFGSPDPAANKWLKLSTDCQNITDGAQFSVSLLEGNKIKDTVTHCQAGSLNLTEKLQPDFTNMRVRYKLTT